MLSSEYKDKFSSNEIKHFIDDSILSVVIEYPTKCKICSNEAEVREDNGKKLLIDVKNPTHFEELKKEDYECFKIKIERVAENVAQGLQKIFPIDTKMKYEISQNDEYFEIIFSDNQRKLSVLVLYGQISKEIMYRLILDLAEQERGFFLLYPARNLSVIEESLPFVQGQLLGMINFTNIGALNSNLKSMDPVAKTYFKLFEFEKRISDKVLSSLDREFRDMIRKIDTNQKYLLNLISRLQIYDKGLINWVNFERMVKLSMRYLFPGDITLGGSQDSGKAISDSINFIRFNGDIGIALIVDAKRRVKEDLKDETTEKYEHYVETIKAITPYTPPKICLLFVAPSFGDVSNFAARFVAKCKDAYICTLDLSSLVAILHMKLSFLLSSTLEVRDSSLESFLGKLFDIDVVNKYRSFRNHYKLDTSLILEILQKEGETRYKSFMKEFEKIKDSIQ